MLAPIRIIGPIRIKTKKRKKKKEEGGPTSVVSGRRRRHTLQRRTLPSEPTSPSPPPPPPVFLPFICRCSRSRSVQSVANCSVVCTATLVSPPTSHLSVSLFAFATQTPNSSHSTGAFVIPLAINSLAVDNIRSGSKKSSC